MENWRLLRTFRSLFEVRKYRHRSPNLGDIVCQQLFEDLYRLEGTGRYAHRVESGKSALSVRNQTVGVKTRRGDGTFGQSVPTVYPVYDPGYRVGRGSVANVEIGIETKIVAKAMRKQIDRVIGDLRRQADEFTRSGLQPITIGIVGVNYARHYASVERDRVFRTDGRAYKHPFQEAGQAVNRLVNEATQAFRHFLILPFEATNEEPYPFRWVNTQRTGQEYAAMLVRILSDYEHRFAA